MQIANLATIIPMRRDYHVVPIPRTNDWGVRLERTMGYRATFDTQTEAIGYGISQARYDAVSLIVHGRDGVIKNVWSY